MPVATTARSPADLPDEVRDSLHTIQRQRSMRLVAAIITLVAIVIGGTTLVALTYSDKPDMPVPAATE